MLSLANGTALPTERVRELAAKVFEKVGVEALRSTHVMVSGGGEGRMTGMSYQKKDFSFIIPDNRNFIVCVTVGSDQSYPFESLYRVRVGPLQFGSWEEEFFAVLSHEIAHVLQWMKLDGFGRHPHYEVEAERFAQKMLLSFKGT